MNVHFLVINCWNFLKILLLKLPTEQRSCPPSLANYETFDEFKYVNEVTISSKTDNFAIGGEDLELNCTFYGIVDDAYNFTWQLPNDIIKKVNHLFLIGNNRISFEYIDSRRLQSLYVL